MTWLRALPGEQARRHRFPDVVLHSHRGRSVRLYEDLLRDRIVALNFTYLACGQACPATTAHLVQAQQLLGARMGRDVFFYSITLDPEADTLPALAEHARRVGAGRGWLFLRARPADTELLRRRLGFFDADPEVDALRSAHAAMIRYGNERRRWWAMLGGDADGSVIARAIARVSDVDGRAAGPSGGKTR